MLRVHSMLNGYEQAKCCCVERILSLTLPSVNLICNCAVLQLTSELNHTTTPQEVRLAS